MVTYFVWKTFIEEKDELFLDEIDSFIVFLTFVITTPVMAVLDIILLPIELLYCIFKKI